MSNEIEGQVTEGEKRVTRSLIVFAVAVAIVVVVSIYYVTT